jgi:uracil-DNA glycosylase
VLAIPSTPLATNFYLSDCDAEGTFSTTAAERLDRLHKHLNVVDGGDVVLVGEAPGWRGARQSGVAFTSAASVGLQGTREASATVVHDVLSEAKLQDRALLWNAFPLHPHEAGNQQSNRAPTPEELAAGYNALSIALLGRRVVCIGRKAQKSVETILGISVPDIDQADADSRAIAVRHPSKGGATLFRTGCGRVFEIWNLR